MKKSILYIIILLFAFLINGFTQEIKFSHNLQITGDKVYVDHIGNIYTTNKDQLIKHNSKGNLLKTYSNKNFGIISLIDISDPMRILVYYQEFNHIQFLDNTLSPINSISLSNLKIEQTKLCCTSNNNGFWTFNLENSELVCLDAKLRIIEKSGNIIQIMRENINPTLIFEKNNQLFLYDNSAGLLVFDRYGAYLKQYPFIKTKHITVIENKIIFFLNNEIISYDMQTTKETKCSFIINDYKSLFITKNNIYLLNEDNLSIYKFLEKK